VRLYFVHDWREHMSNEPLIKVGKIVTSMRDIILVGNCHVTVLSSNSPLTLPKGTKAEITAVGPTFVELNCKDGQDYLGPAAWGLKIRIILGVWGISFQ